jgi:hypothetical protein
MEITEQGGGSHAPVQLGVFWSGLRALWDAVIGRQ